MMRHFTPLIALIALAVFAAAAPVAAQSSDDDDTLVALVNVSVIPMDTEGVIADATVVVEGDRIIIVGPVSEVEVPDGAQVIDGNGGYVIPGLADMHYHADGEPNSLTLAIANGVTTVQNLNADDFGSDSALATAVAGGERIGPRVVNAFHTTGLPGENLFAFEQINQALEPWFSLNDYLDSLVGPPLGMSVDAVAARDFVARAVEAGTGSFKTNLYLPRDGFDVIVEEAAERDMIVQGHVSASIGMEHYLSSGAHPHHISEIAPYLSGNAPQGSFQPWDFALIDERLPELVRLMVDNGTWFTPTVNLVWYLDQNLNDREGLLLRPETQYLPPGEQRPMTDPETNVVVQVFGTGSDSGNAELGTRYMEIQKRIISELHAAGVPLLAGTDASGAPASIRGFDIHLELELLVDHGLTPFEALQAATSSPAQFWDESEEWGTVAVGSRADIVLLGSNPLDDITATRDIDGVMAAGTWHPAGELQAMLDEIAAEYEALANITMAPFTSEELGMTGLAPAEWTEREPGVWTRSDPDSDPTFLIQQAAPAANSEDLVAGVLGNFGATELGEQIDAVEVDGVTWEIFAPQAELGLLVARADIGDRVFVAALAALPNEIDDLTELVFRPAVSALQEAPS